MTGDVAARRSGTAVSGSPVTVPGVRLTLALGIVLVGYSYLVALWPSRYQVTPRPVVLAREWLNFPLGIGEDFGMLGVALLLLSLGYTAADAVSRLGTRRACATLLVRGYLPFAFAATLSWLLLLAGARPFTDGAPGQLSISAYLSNLALVDGLLGEQTLFGLGWVIVVGTLFCLLVLATAALLTRVPLAATAVQLAVAVTAVVAGGTAGGWVAELGQLSVYLSFPLLGELIWTVRERGVPGWAAAPAGLGCLAVVIAGERIYPELAGWLYALTTVYAVLILLLSLARGAGPGRSTIVGWAADRTYPLFLLIGVVGYPILFAFDDVAFAVALPLAVAGTVAAAEGLFRLMTAVRT
ncbi:hypothetical protein H0B56_18330 [Haloechinothrix sp. YIM 98757]|uniref:Acyltransferase family protein n=1 Tax=Haloechinothrix aidingensis TaxID=2752311 RepID=A0A838ADX8_9PSEU|nr:hypothetical protein [Haloechinothrix aidingensis]MBA0127506.1 hypothetical protein [Haloechinothrix aidingensis]